MTVTRCYRRDTLMVCTDVPILNNRDKIETGHITISNESPRYGVMHIPNHRFNIFFTEQEAKAMVEVLEAWLKDREATVPRPSPVPSEDDA